MDSRMRVDTYLDFPREGINFIDINSITQDPFLWKAVIKDAFDRVVVLDPNFILAVEARGFLLAAALAKELGVGFITLRKQGKLPGNVTGVQYQTEYSKDVLEVQTERLRGRARVLIVDDVLATGGTINAAVQLCRATMAVPIAGLALFNIKALEPTRKTEVPVVTLYDH